MIIHAHHYIPSTALIPGRIGPIQQGPSGSARSSRTLGQLTTDGSALNDKLVRSVEAAIFAVRTAFVNPIYGVDNTNNSKFRLVNKEIKQEIGRMARSYADVAYDAFWVAVLTENGAGGTNNITSLKRIFVQIADSYTGITGDTSLNEAGDRKHGNYDFWAIKPNNGNNNGFAWTQVGRFKINASIKGGGLIRS